MRVYTVVLFVENTRLKRSRSQSVIQALLTAENVPQDQVQGL